MKEAAMEIIICFFIQYQSGQRDREPSNHHEYLALCLLLECPYSETRSLVVKRWYV